MDLTMFEKMQQLPLFQGMTRFEMSERIERVKLNFCQNKAGEIFAEQGERCDRLIYVLRGKFTAEYLHAEDKYSMTEVMDGPSLIEPYNIYGLNQEYSRTYKFVTDGSTFVIDKLAFKNFLMNYDIVKANMLNIICTRCQNISKRLWLSNNGDIESKILKFLKIHSLQPNGEKRLKIKMEDLARLMGESRINVSRALNAMQDRGIAELKRKEIIIFDIEKATEGI